MNYMDVEQMIEDRRRGNFGYWLKWRKTWTRQEAAFLLLAKCPLDFQDDPTPAPVENLLHIMESDPALPERVSPLAAAQWFQRTFGEVVELPPELIALLEEAPAPDIGQQRSLIGRQGREVRAEKTGEAAFREKALQMAEQLHKKRPGDSPRQLGIKIAETLFTEGQKIGVLFSWDRAPETIADWIRKARSIS